MGFFGTASGPILPMLVHAYRRKFPDVELHLYELNPDQQLAAFDEGRIDLGFSRALPTDRRSEFEEELVYTDQLVIALPAAHSFAKQKVIRLKSLAGEPFVQFHRKGAPAFKRDFEYLHLIGLATDANEFRRAVEALRSSSRLNDGELRRLLRCRVSSERLMKLQTILHG